MDDQISDDAHQGPSAVPALVALAVVVGVALAMVGATFTNLKATSEQTSVLLDDSLRSARMLNEIEIQVVRLEIASGDEAQAIEKRLATEIAAYEPLVNRPGAAEELARFKLVVDQLRTTPQDAPERKARFEHLGSSLARLAEINSHAAAQMSAQINDSHRTALTAQIVAGVMTLAAALVAALLMWRALRRQRLLIEHYVTRLRLRNRDLAAFAGHTAHDLRGPLSPIRGWAELLAEGGPVDVLTAADRIRKGTDRMTEIIDTLLALALSGHPPPGEVDVGPFVRTVLAEQSSRFSDAEVRSSLDDCRVACSPSVLRQVLQNILDNASKYRSPERKLVVRVEAKRIDSMVEIAIDDNGLGMSDEAVAKMFDPYYRAAGTRSIAGSGLGLAIVKRMIEAVGGTCAVTSRVGEGTHFVLRIPAV